MLDELKPFATNERTQQLWDAYSYLRAAEYYSCYGMDGEHPPEFSDSLFQDPRSSIGAYVGLGDCINRTHEEMAKMGDCMDAHLFREARVFVFEMRYGVGSYLPTEECEAQKLSERFVKRFDRQMSGALARLRLLIEDVERACDSAGLIADEADGWVRSAEFVRQVREVEDYYTAATLKKNVCLWAQKDEILRTNHKKGDDLRIKLKPSMVGVLSHISMLKSTKEIGEPSDAGIEELRRRNGR